MRKSSEVVPIEGTLTIYQLLPGEANRYRRWEGIESLHRLGEKPEFKNYSKVYSMEIESTATLDEIYMRFNTNKPPDFKGHSLSVSDIIVLDFEDRETAAYYVNDVGFVKCEEFARRHEHELYRSANYYGYIEYLGKNGKVGETWYFKDKATFTAEINESMEIGRPIAFYAYGKQAMRRIQQQGR